MYEHPYLAYTVTAFDQEQRERAIERRRFIAEHPDQIVPRAAGPVRRMLQRMRLRGAGTSDAVASADRRAGGVCEPVAAR
ncbi:hypothetical protein [Microbacterium sp. 3J1]|uniref:hypothetical protein n=1 Tax=Microbacterium sp. 3J1 TaxID=861269 RepID=UPI000A716977|nr:hypothetical protein [Microbacterium sp. 3J1]